MTFNFNDFDPVQQQPETVQSVTKFWIKKIPKGRGKYRTIYRIERHEILRLRAHLPYLEAVLDANDDVGANYAFTKNSNCTLNALQHTGFQYTLSFDLEEFFDSVVTDHVDGIICSDVITECFIDGAPRQGLPTSPIIATIAFLKCDREIHETLRRLSINCVYTRYADDLTVSYDNPKDAGKIRFTIEQVVAANRFCLNRRKTKLQSLKNGRIVITGVAIDEYGLYPTRKTKKKIRAAKHQGNIASTRGLIEWSKCKLPKGLVSSNG